MPGSSRWAQSTGVRSGVAVVRRRSGLAAGIRGPTWNALAISVEDWEESDGWDGPILLPGRGMRDRPIRRLPSLVPSTLMRGASPRPSWLGRAVAKRSPRLEMLGVTPPRPAASRRDGRMSPPRIWPRTISRGGPPLTTTRPGSFRRTHPHPTCPIIVLQGHEGATAPRSAPARPEVFLTPDLTRREGDPMAIPTTAPVEQSHGKLDSSPARRGANRHRIGGPRGRRKSSDPLENPRASSSCSRGGLRRLLRDSWARKRRTTKVVDSLPLREASGRRPRAHHAGSPTPPPSPKPPPPFAGRGHRDSGRAAEDRSASRCCEVLRPDPSRSSSNSTARPTTTRTP